MRTGEKSAEEPEFLSLPVGIKNLPRRGANNRKELSQRKTLRTPEDQNSNLTECNEAQPPSNRPHFITIGSFL
jgi:hypothetical protein